MFYVDVYPPVYVQPEIVIEQRYIQPVIEQPVAIPAYPTVEIQRTIRTPYGTTIIEYNRERIYHNYDY